MIALAYRARLHECPDSKEKLASHWTAAFGLKSLLAAENPAKGER